MTMTPPHKSPSPQQKLLHAEELARLAGVHKSTILQAIRRGDLHASRTVGRSARITPEDAKAYLLARGKLVPDELSNSATLTTIAVLTENAEVHTIVRQAAPAHSDMVGSESLYGSMIAVGARAPAIVIVDLDVVFMNPIALLRSLRAITALRASTLVAVGLRDDLFAAARAAGAAHTVTKIDHTALSNVLRRLSNANLRAAAE
jgi:excisionase family DNA binding protein